MADSKITALTSISTSTDPAVDPLVIVDVSDTSMAATGTTKKVTLNNLLSSSPTATGAFSVTGLVTAGSATITGDLTVDTNVLKVDTTNNRVGIGTASPVASFQATLSGLYGLCIQSADTNNSALNIGNDPTSGYAFIDATKSGSGSFLPLRLSTSDNERIRIETAGDVKIVTGNVVMATSGKGIDFSAVTGGTGTATANVLNDYEEGTFTPIISGSTTAGVGVYSEQTGRYTKVGRIVTVDISLTWSAHTGTGNIRIDGLPFSSNSVSSASGSIGILSNIAMTANYIATAYNYPSSTLIFLLQYATGGSAAISIPMDTAGAITVSMSYTV